MSKLMRFFKYMKDASRKKESPTIINLDITSKCNLNCEHCYWRKTYDSKKELSDEEWKKLFLKYKSKGTEAAFLTGGEPALRLNVIREANKIFKSITIVSNGTLKIPEDIQRRIFVSIDGPREVHDKIRGVKVFDKVMKNIKNDKRVILTPTLSTTNYKYIDNIVKIARESGVEGVTFSTYTSHKSTDDKLYLKDEKLDWTINKLKEVYKKNKDIIFLTPSVIKLFKTKKQHKKCLMRNKKEVTSFDANGNIKEPCVFGKGIKCETCGCIIPIMYYALSHADVKAWFLFDKLYPERYYKVFD